MAAPVTAVAFAPRMPGANAAGEGGTGRDLLAVGLESGELELWAISESSVGVECVWRAAQHMRHGAAIRRLCWAPLQSKVVSEQPLQLASCGDDHVVRVYAVHFMR